MRSYSPRTVFIPKRARGAGHLDGPVSERVPGTMGEIPRPLGRNGPLKRSGFRACPGVSIPIIPLLLLSFFPGVADAPVGELSGWWSSVEGPGGGAAVIGRGWRILGYMQREDGAAELSNLGIETPWGAAGGLEARGIVRELILPSLTRNSFKGGKGVLHLMGGRQWGPRQGGFLALPGQEAGFFGWGREGLPSMGGWLRLNPFERLRFSGGFLMKELPESREEDWLLSEPVMFSPIRLSLGMEGRYSPPGWDVYLGLFVAGGEADKPGAWGRGGITFQGEWAEMELQAGVSTSCAWTGGGKRLDDALHYRGTFTLMPLESIRLGVTFLETHGHRGMIPTPFRPHEAQGRGEINFSLGAWDAAVVAARRLRGDEAGILSLKDWWDLSLGWEERRLRISLEFQGIYEGDEWEYRGEASAVWEGRHWRSSIRGKGFVKEGQTDWSLGGSLSIGGPEVRLNMKGTWEAFADSEAGGEVSISLLIKLLN